MKSLIGTCAACFALFLGSVDAGADAVTADINDDARVDSRDTQILDALNGIQSGEIGYRDSLDLNKDGGIDAGDSVLLRPYRRAVNVAITPTTVAGRVFDGIGNPLEGVSVVLGSGPSADVTDQLGQYSISVPAADLGENFIHFHAGSAVDPTPGLFGGSFPDVLNIPLYINGGTDEMFRDMPISEEDAHGALILNGSNSTPGATPNSRVLSESVRVDNAGVSLLVPLGCEIKFQPGDPQRLSLMRVDPGSLPAPLPPEFSSNVIVSYYPAAAEIDCPALQQPTIEFDNNDAFELGVGSSPVLAQLLDGVLTPLANCLVEDRDTDSAAMDLEDRIVCGPIVTPVVLSLHHLDDFSALCPRTTVVGTVLGSDTAPSVDAGVAVPGAPGVRTDSNGDFRIENVPAGPNGIFCNTRAFTLRVSSSDGTEVGVSAPIPAVPGGITSVGTIVQRSSGTVQGRVSLLTRFSPIQTEQLGGATVTLSGTAGFSASGTTDTNGGYNVANVPIGPYTVAVDFDGTVALPDGSTRVKNIRASQSGEIDFNGDIDAIDFRLVAAGTVKVTVLDQNADPIENADIDVTALGNELGAGYTPTALNCNEVADVLGTAVVGDELTDCPAALESTPLIPIGSCEVTASISTGATATAACFVNEFGQEVEVEIVLIDEPLLSGIPTFRVSPKRFDFGPAIVGAVLSSQTATITNISSTAIQMSGAGGGTAAPFSTSQNCQGQTLNPGDSCQMTFRYTPTTIGQQTATSNISWNGVSMAFELFGTTVLPGLTVSPQVLNYGDVGLTAGPVLQEVEITNESFDPLTISAAGGGLAAPFSASQNCQGVTLAQGDSCKFFFRFDPSTLGNASATSNFSLNGVPASIAMSGRGVNFLPVGLLRAIPRSLDFGRTVVNTSAEVQIVDITNVSTISVVMSGAGGGTPAPFSVSQNCQGQTLDPGESCQMSFRFAPAATGVFTDASNISWNGQPFSFELRGEGVAPTFRVSPTLFDFGPAIVGATLSPQTATITNISSTAIQMSGAGGGTAAPFSTSQNCQGQTLNPGDSCQMFFRYAPATVGQQTATSNISWNGVPMQFELTGTTVLSRLIVSPSALDYGPVGLAEGSVLQTTTITNDFFDPLTISLAGGGVAAPFSASQNCQGVTLAQGESCMFFFRFDPSILGDAIATSNFSVNGVLASIELRGTGVNFIPIGLLRAIPRALEFGQVLVDTNAAVQTIDITNVSTISVVMSGAGGGTPAPFSVSQNCQGQTLNPGESCQMSFRFAPGAQGIFTDASNISWNGQPFSFELRGEGVIPVSGSGSSGPAASGAVPGSAPPPPPGC